jgi:hypothetical protein
MRDAFLRKIKEIQLDDDLSISLIRSDMMVYSRRSGDLREYPLENPEYRLLSTGMFSTFFTDVEQDRIPNILATSNTLPLEVFAHSYRPFLDARNVKSIDHLDLSEQEVGLRLGPIESEFDEYENIVFHVNKIWSVITFRENDTLFVFSIPEGGPLEKVVDGCFPLYYLTGFVDDLEEVEWDVIEHEAFVTYLARFAQQEEKQPLLLHYR